jgi:hypothetical protein
VLKRINSSIAKWKGIFNKGRLEMKRFYIPCNTERLALVTFFCGLDKDGEPEIELDEDPIIMWRVEEDGNQITNYPMVAGYLDLDCVTVRIAVDTYDGRVICNGREFENRNHYFADCKDFWKAMSQEGKVLFDNR